MSRRRAGPHGRAIAHPHRRQQGARACTHKACQACTHARTHARASTRTAHRDARARASSARAHARTHAHTNTHAHAHAHARTHTERTRARTVPLAAVFARLLRVHIVFVFCFFHKNKCFLFFSYTFFLVGETGGRPLLSSFRNFVLFLSKFRIFGPVLVPPSYLFFLFIFIFF